jgi:hypothetical protein
MKAKIFALILAFAGLPVLGLAQMQQSGTMPAGGSPQFTQQQMRQHLQIFRQYAEKMRAAQSSARATVLSSLTPAHRALLARIAGQLAVSTNPDRRAAARQLDAVLSSREKSVILSQQSHVMSQMRAYGEQMHHQMTSMMTQAQRSQMQTMMAHHGGMMMRHHERRLANDPGAALLRMAMREGGPMMVMMGHGFGAAAGPR